MRGISSVRNRLPRRVQRTCYADRRSESTQNLLQTCNVELLSFYLRMSSNAKTTPHPKEPRTHYSTVARDITLSILPASHPLDCVSTVSKQTKPFEKSIPRNNSQIYTYLIPNRPSPNQPIPRAPSRHISPQQHPSHTPQPRRELQSIYHPTPSHST
jgi:hypothetical protein